MKYYSKTIDERLVISTCKVLKIGGIWISNPSEEQIYADGWEDYVAPDPSTTPKTEPDAFAIIEDFKAFFRSEVDAITDEQALAVKSLFPAWVEYIGKEVAAGLRLWYNDELYKVVQAHTAQSDWTPDITPALYTLISLDEWPEFVQPTGASDAYNQGDKITYEGEHYISLIDNNVWSPDDYAAGWEKQA